GSRWRSARSAWYAAGATPRPTARTCTGTGRSRPASGRGVRGGHRRPGGVRVGVRGTPGPGRRRPGGRDRRPRPRAVDRILGALTTPVRERTGFLASPPRVPVSQPAAAPTV